MPQHLARTDNYLPRAPNIEIIDLLQSAGIESDLPLRQNLIRQLHSDIHAALASILLHINNFATVEARNFCETIRRQLRDWATAGDPATTTSRGMEYQSRHPILDLQFLYNPDRHHQILLAALLGTLVGLLCAAQSTLVWLLDQPSYISSWNHLPIREEDIDALRTTMLTRESGLERLRRETIRVLDTIEQSGRWTEYLGYDNYALDEERRTYRLPYRSLWHALVDMEGFVEGLHEMLPRLMEAASARGIWMDEDCEVEEEENDEDVEAKEVEEPRLESVDQRSFERAMFLHEVGAEQSEGEDGEGEDGEGEEDEEDGEEDCLDRGRKRPGTENDCKDPIHKKSCSVVLMEGRPGLARLTRRFGYTNPRRCFNLVGPASSLSISIRA